MKISKLIADLKKIQDNFGDIDTMILGFKEGTCCAQDWECDFCDEGVFDVVFMGDINENTLFLEGRMP